MQKYEDLILKQAWSTFAHEGLEMFGIKSKVKSSGPTDAIKLAVEKMYLDYTYLMEDNTFSHFQFQSTNNNKSDLRRFRANEAWLSHQEGKEVITYVIYSGGIKNPTTALKTGINTYRVRAISLAKFDSKAELKSVMDKAKRGIDLTKRDMMAVAFNPLMGGKASLKEKFIASANAAKLFDSLKQEKIEASLYALALKFLDSNDKEEVKELIKVTWLGQMLYDDGREEGREEGLVEGIKASIKILLKLSVPKEEAKQQLMETYHLSEDESEKS